MVVVVVLVVVVVVTQGMRPQGGHEAKDNIIGRSRDKERGTNEKGLDHRTAFSLSAPAQGVCTNAAVVAPPLAVQSALPVPEYPSSQTNATLPPVVDVPVPVPPLLSLLATSIDEQVAAAAQTLWQ